MNILATQYTLATKAFEIYISGCSGNPHCKGCHNPASWDFDLGEPFNDEYFSNIKRKVEEFDTLVKNIMIFGGEPLDNDHEELTSLLYKLKEFNKPIWLFTRYSIIEVPYEIKQLCDYIKCGRYDASKLVDDNIQYGIKLASSNQEIYKKGLDY